MKCTELNFEDEMERFLKPLSDFDRGRLANDMFYRIAVEERNAEKAQRIAAEILFGNMPTMDSARLLRKLMAP